MGFINDFINKHRADYVRPEDAPKERACSMCKEILPLTAEYFHRGEAFMGFVSACKTCRNRSYRAAYRKRNPIPEKPASFCCKICGVEKPFTTEYYGRVPRNRWGLRYRCKACRSAPRRARPYVPKGMRFCTSCRTIKPKENFGMMNCKPYNGGRQYTCRKCQYELPRGLGRKKYQQEYFGGRTSFDWLWDYIQSPEFDPKNDLVIADDTDKLVEIEDWID